MLRRDTEPEDGVVGQFDGVSAASFGQIAFRQYLETPGDGFDEPGLVVGLHGFAEDFGEALA